LKKFSCGRTRAAWREASATIQPRRKKKRLFFPKALTDEMMQSRTVHKSHFMTRGELYEYHRRNGTLGLFWAMFGMPEPVA
jgi:hypothetical protein